MIVNKALVKANNDLINWCECSEPHWATTGQADCPWCGCGWLFTCTGCGKAFTFAKVVETRLTYEEIVRVDLERHYGKDDVDQEDLDWHIQWISTELKDLKVGEVVVILDGKILPVKSRNVSFAGWFAKHEFEIVPQVFANGSAKRAKAILGMEYWLEREIPDGDGNTTLGSLE